MSRVRNLSQTYLSDKNLHSWAVLYVFELLILVLLSLSFSLSPSLQWIPLLQGAEKKELKLGDFNLAVTADHPPAAYSQLSSDVRFLLFYASI